MSCLIRVYAVSIAIHLNASGMHLRAARTCRARFSCREYVLWHCVHTCIIKRLDGRVRVWCVIVGEEMGDRWKKVEGRDSGGVEWEKEGGRRAGGLEARRSCGWRSGVCCSLSGWSGICSCCRKTIPIIYMHQSMATCMMVISLSCSLVGKVQFPPSSLVSLQTTRTRVAHHGHRSSTQCSET